MLLKIYITELGQAAGFCPEAEETQVSRPIIGSPCNKGRILQRDCDQIKSFAGIAESLFREKESLFPKRYQTGTKIGMLVTKQRNKLLS